MINVAKLKTGILLSVTNKSTKEIYLNKVLVSAPEFSGGDLNLIADAVRDIKAMGNREANVRNLSLKDVDVKINFLNS